MKTIKELAGSAWTGKAELWLDPLGNESVVSDCTMAIDEAGVTYTWSHDGKPHRGGLKVREGGADFTDTFHSPTSMSCDEVPSLPGLLAVAGTYAAGDGPPWRWRTTLSVRPSGELVLQMTNVTPWGEDGRAVRMIATRDD